MNKLAQGISVIFHPLSMPLLGTWLLLHADTYLSYALQPRMQFFLYLVVFTSTWLVPVTLTWMLLQRGMISSLELKDRHERHLPYLLTLASYGASVYLLFPLPVPRLFVLMLIGASLTILLSFLINLRWKISVHMIGIGGLTGLLYGYALYFHLDLLPALLLLVMVAGCIGTARLYRKSHSPAQVYAGYLTGFGTCFGFLWMLTSLL